MTAARTSHVLQTADRDGQRLRCEFVEIGGRFQHTVALVGDAEVTTVLASLSPDDEHTWPASPPWQELHVHQQTDGVPALMLVGRAGSSHWSMSATVDPADNALLFDVACRAGEPADFLGETYAAEAAADQLSITAVRLGEAAPAKVIRTDKRVVIDATEVQRSLGTVRWAYRIAAA